MTTLFISLVLAGFSIFMVVLGIVWAQNFIADLRRHRARGP